MPFGRIHTNSSSTTPSEFPPGSHRLVPTRTRAARLVTPIALIPCRLLAGGIGGSLLVALGLALVILVVVYRAVLLPLVVLLTSVFALAVALLTN